MQYLVICLSWLANGTEEYVLSTRTVFSNKESAEEYARGIAPSRKAIVVGSINPIKEDIRAEI